MSHPSWRVPDGSAEGKSPCVKQVLPRCPQAGVRLHEAPVLSASWKPCFREEQRFRLTGAAGVSVSLPVVSGRILPSDPQAPSYRLRSCHAVVGRRLPPHPLQPSR